MKSSGSHFISSILVLVTGLLLIIFPTAVTSGISFSTFAFYPELLLCLIFATAFNKPKAVNFFSILFLLMFSDILQMKPIGLLTFIVLVCYMFIKRFEKKIEVASFYTHYFLFFLVISSIQALNVSLHYVFFMPELRLIIVLNQTIFTLMLSII